MSMLNRLARSSGQVDGPHEWAPGMCILTPIHILNVILRVSGLVDQRRVLMGIGMCLMHSGLVQAKHTL